MSDELPRRSLEHLKKEAKRWLQALRVDTADARARFTRAYPDGPSTPTLRDVQHAVAREHGFAGWPALKQAFERAAAQTAAAGAHALAEYEAMAAALLDAYRTGTAEAMERHYRYTWHRRPWPAMRTYAQLDLGKRPAGPHDEVEIVIDDARALVAMEHGFADWAALQAFTASGHAGPAVAAKPVRLVAVDAADEAPPLASSRRWDEIVRLLAAHPSARLHAEGQMTDEVLASVARVEHLTALDLSGSRALTDEGARQLVRLRGLRHLDLSGTAITDRALEILCELPALETLGLAMTHISDEGLASLTQCRELREVNLSWTHTGDGALRALAGMPKLHTLSTGNNITDAGMRLLHDLPVFKVWQGGETRMALLDAGARPNHLSLRGRFTDRGLQELQGLDGLFGLSLDGSYADLTAAALAPLVSLPRLGWLSVDATDETMRDIAAMPALRFLSAQDTVASDAGFVELSRSRSLEYIWGRRCHNLRRTGFLALATMPSLRGLSVSCLNVDEEGIAALPSFPALRELMPIDVPDAGYRHIGRCTQLQSLILMYCRETTDAATEQITGLRELQRYFNSYTTITDRTPELLSGMDSLERITFAACHNLTNAGVARLARLPKLRELRVSGHGLTAAVAESFSGVTAHYTP